MYKLWLLLLLEGTGVLWGFAFSGLNGRPDKVHVRGDCNRGKEGGRGSKNLIVKIYVYQNFFLFLHI